MTKTSPAIPISSDSDSLCELIIDAVQDIKGKKILKFDLKKLDESPADYFIICEGESHTQVKGISNNIYKRLRDERGLRPHKTEGEQHAAMEQPASNADRHRQNLHCEDGNDVRDHRTRTLS